jgi:hypothetical protein
MTQFPIGCPLGEPHVRNQLRLHTVHSIAGADISGEWRLRNLQGGQPAA